MSWVAVVLIAFVLVPWLTSVKAKHPNAHRDLLDLITSSLATRSKFDFDENKVIENIKMVSTRK